MSFTRRDALKLSVGLVAANLVSGQAGRSPAAAQTAAQELPKPIVDLLDPDMEWSVLIRKEVVTSTYYAIAQYDNDTGAGEPVFIRDPGNGQPVILDDVNSLPFEVVVTTRSGPDPQSSADFDAYSFGLSSLDLQVYESLSGKAASSNLDQKMFNAAAKHATDVDRLSSATASGTNHGRLACAWAVNKIAELSLGRPIGGGLATANMIKVLKARHLIVPESSVVPGAIVISPTEYTGRRANIGHVGIVGENGKIYSNSSGRARWEQNFKLEDWKSHYSGKKGLEVYFFRLDEDYFP